MFDRFRKKTSTTEVAARLRDSLADSLGQNLLSLIQYFPDGVDPQGLNVAQQLRVLIVLDVLDLTSLNACADALQAVSGSELVAPMVLSHAELVSSTDVFPVTFLEMKQHYEVLTGKDVLAELVISDAHLRLRCEQELKNLLLRMQSAFLRQNHHATALLESVRASYSAFQRCLRTAIRVYGDPLPDDERETVSLAAKKLGLDREVIERIEETCGVDSSVGAEALAEIYGQMLVEVHRAATVIDALGEEEIIELDSVEG